MKRSIFTLLIALIILPAYQNAQEKKCSLSASADFVSRYVWRGTDFGNSPSVQPSIEWARGKFTAGFWGSYAMNDANFQEADLYLTFSPIEEVSITFTDYFLPDHLIARNMYFEYDQDRTGHVLEGAASFNGTEKIPLSLMVAVNFYGADARNADGDLFYSTYAELGYSAEVNGTPYDLFLGFSPSNADEDKGESGYYGNNPGIINLGITAHKDIRISDSFSLPLFTSLIVNPQTENIFLVLGLSL
jgi:hypothetical protein